MNINYIKWKTFFGFGDLFYIIYLFDTKSLTMLRPTILLLALLSIFFCTQNKPEDEYLRRAKALLATTPIVDTHIDFPWYLVEHKKWHTHGYTAFVLLPVPMTS